MPDKSTPSHSDPENEDSPGKKLKLKRVVFEDTEIKPREDKEWAPVPQAEAYQAPVEEPVPVEPAPLTPQQIGQPPVDEPLDDPEDLEELENEEAEESSVSPGLRLALLVIPAAILIGVMVFLLKTYDPFDDNLSRIKPPEIPVEILAKKNAPVMEVSTAEDGMEGGIQQGARLSLQDFLGALQQQPLTATANPRGVFIDSVFIPEGAALNKQIGVVFSSLLIEDGEALVVITSPDGSKLSLPATVSLQ